jgi:hypothetical protein
MSFAAVLGLTLVLVTVIVLGITLVTYLSSLARSAYELKVELRREMEDGMKRIEAETLRQTKFARGELMTEIERCRTATNDDIERRHAEYQTGAIAREALWVEQRDALIATVASLEDRLARLEPRTVGRVRAIAEAQAAIPSAPAAEPPPPANAAMPLALENFETPPQPIKAKAR